MYSMFIDHSKRSFLQSSIENANKLLLEIRFYSPLVKFLYPPFAQLALTLRMDFIAALSSRLNHLTLYSRNNAERFQ